MSDQTPDLFIVGLGAGRWEQLTVEAAALLLSGYPLYLRTGKHLLVEDLVRRGVEFQTFDHLYEEAESFEEVYNRITQELLMVATQQHPLIYAVPGSPLMGEIVVHRLLNQAREGRLKIKTVLAPGFIDAVCLALGVDPAAGLQVRDGADLTGINADQGLLIMQPYSRLVASEIKLALMRSYPDEHPVRVVRAAGLPEETVTEIPLFELDRQDHDHLVTLYIPPRNTSSYVPGRDISDLLRIMATLRGEEGCPWDRQQTHHSLKKYVVEEAYEVVDAVERGNMYKICEELGDLLLQVVFHTQLGEEKEEFNFGDVVFGITEKLIRRHPHVFAGATASTAEQVKANWDKIKETEQGEVVSVLGEIPRGWPSLMLAQKIQSRAAKVGFDWASAQEAWPKVQEEMGEVQAALVGGVEKEIGEELGDLLFAVVNVTRLLGHDAEEALRQTIGKFVGRFHYLEQKTREAGRDLRQMTLAEMDELWEKAKKL